MKTTLLTFAVAAALAALAGCDRTPEQRPSQTPPTSSAGGASSAPATPQANTPSTPANVGQPQSQAEKREGSNPVQQQIDPKQGEQQRDFKQSGDGAGPKPGG